MMPSANRAREHLREGVLGLPNDPSMPQLAGMPPARDPPCVTVSAAGERRRRGGALSPEQWRTLTRLGLIGSETKCASEALICSLLRRIRVALPIFAHADGQGKSVGVVCGRKVLPPRGLAHHSMADCTELVMASCWLQWHSGLPSKLRWLLLFRIFRSCYHTFKDDDPLPSWFIVDSADGPSRALRPASAVLTRGRGVP